MPTRNPNDPINASTPQAGYEASDVSATGIAVFLVSLLAFVAVFFVFCFGMGKVINNQLVKRDGPPEQMERSRARIGRSSEEHGVEPGDGTTTAAADDAAFPDSAPGDR